MGESIDVRIAPLIWLSDRYLHYNPFFMYFGRNPLLHQTETVARTLFLKPTRILLADVIGLGKTITALRILRTLENYVKIRRVLIIVPSVLLDQWVEEASSMGKKLDVIERKSLDFYRKMPELPSGCYIGSMDTLKREEYLDILRRNEWHAIVVDEAHKLGYIGREPNQRWLRLGEVIRANKEAVLLLLSATPHRGKANDYLSRLALIDPTLLEVANVGALEKVFDKPEFYKRTHGVILHRRSKDDINKLYEKREVFKPCIMTATLIEPNSEERDFLRITTGLATEYLNRYYARMLYEYGWKTGRVQGIVALLRVLLVKRGLSSPSSLVKTFSKLVVKRGKLTELLEQGYSFEEAQEKLAEELEEYGRKLDEVLTGDIGDAEEELDEEFGKIATYFSAFLDKEFINKLERVKEIADRILKGEIKDSKLETLKKILRTVMGVSSTDLPDEFKDLPSGKVIVFTEFKDTAHYLYERLGAWAEEKFGEKDVVRIFTSDNRGDIEDIKRWLSGDGKRILITTDVAGEGLNLQYANVLINYEIAWSPIRLEQRIGRVWRYGQKRITYVFNLFLADALEKEVADVVFSKLYGISISVGKLEPILGEKVLYSTIKNELLEHAFEERTPVGGLVPIELDFKGKKISLSESRIIDLVAKDAQAFVAAFIRALKKLMKEIKVKRIYPSHKDPEEVRSELRFLMGFADTREVVEAVRKLVESFATIMNCEIEDSEDTLVLRTADGKIYEFELDSPEDALNVLLKHFESSEHVKHFAFKGENREILLLAEADVLLGDEVRFKEPIGIQAIFGPDNISLKLLRGLELVEKISKLLEVSIPVDELFGLEEITSQIPQIIDASHNKYYEEALRNGVLEILEQLKEYEEFKKMKGGQRFFYTREPTVRIGGQERQPAFIFISSAFLPEVESKVSEEVWEWAEDETMPIVFNYEGLGGRTAERVSKHEHYDVLSEKRDQKGMIIERRFIEVKAKMGRSLAVRLTREEAEVGEQKGDEYWLYIVYGVRTNKPVILAIRDPLKRLRFQRYAVKVEEEGYVFRI